MSREPENFTSVEPMHSRLKKHIAYYYFHSNNVSSETVDFTYYPHINHAVTAYIGSSVAIDQKKTFVFPEEDKFTALYSRLQFHPHQVNIEGDFKKIGIVFKPYGINHFVSKPLKEISPNVISIFAEWNPEFSEVTRKIWNGDSVDNKISLLEDFLMKQFTNNGDPALQQIIDKITEEEELSTVSQVSEEFQMNRKRLYRLFVRELGCSPTNYFKIIRFRKSLETYLRSNKESSTQAALAHFYDQADFIRNVKAKTNDTPKRLSKNISRLNEKTYWKFD